MKTKTLAFLLFITSLLSACGGGGSDMSLADTSVSSIRVTAPRTQLKAGETIELSATGVQNNGSTRFVSVTWSLSDPSMGSILSNRFTAKKAGEVEVIATEIFTKISGRLKLTISPSSPTGVNIVGFQADKIKYAVGDTRTLTAVAIHPENSSTPITTPAPTWTSSSPTIATVDSTGKFTALAPGNVDITVDWNGFTKKTTLNIVAKEANPIVVTCISPVPVASRSAWNTRVSADPQNGSEWLQFDSNLCTADFVGLYLRDESKKPTTGGESTDFFTLISATRVDGKYQTSIVSSIDVATNNKFITAGSVTRTTAIFFEPFANTGVTLAP